MRHITQLLLFILLITSTTSCSVRYIVVVKDKKVGSISKTGKVLIPIQYEALSRFSNQRALIKINDKYGYINKRNKIIISSVYENAQIFSERLAAVKVDGQYGFINKRGKMKIKNLYKSTSYGFHCGLAYVWLSKDTSGYINRKGELIIQLGEATNYPFQKGYAEINEYDTLQKKWQRKLINKKGKITYRDTISYKYRWVESYPHIYRKNNKQGLLNRRGDTLTQPIYDVMASIIGERIIYRINNKWGAMDKKGKIIIEPKYDRINHFFNGCAKVMQDNKWGFVDKKGKLIVEPIFEKTGDFHYGLASVCIDNKLCFINKKGKIVLSTDYDFTYGFFK